MDNQAGEAEAEGTAFLKVAFDLPTERGGLLSLAAEYIEKRRPVDPVVCFYRHDERIMMVSSRSTDNLADRERAVKEILNLYPTMPNCDSILLSWCMDEVKLEGGVTSPAMVIILVKRNGAEAMIYPFHISEDTGDCVFDNDAMPDPNAGRQYPAELSHAFAVYAFSWNGIGDVKEVCQWLFSKGHEIQFFGGYNINNVDAKSSLMHMDHLTDDLAIEHAQ